MFCATHAAIRVGNISPKGIDAQSLGVWTKGKQAKDLGLSPLMTQDSLLGERDKRKAQHEKDQEEQRAQKLVPDDFETFLPPKEKPLAPDLPTKPFEGAWKQKYSLIFGKEQKKH